LLTDFLLIGAVGVLKVHCYPYFFKNKALQTNMANPKSPFKQYFILERRGYYIALLLDRAVNE